MLTFYTPLCDKISSPIPDLPNLTSRYRGVRDRLLSDKLVAEKDILFSSPLHGSLLELVHTSRYVEQVLSRKRPICGDLDLCLGFSMNKPIVDLTVDFVHNTVGAANAALSEGVAVNIGGGLHHAFPSHASGFCIFNDIAIAIRHLQECGQICRAMVIDCDAHQGDGTAFIFRDDPDVVTFSIHNGDNFPWPKQQSTLDVEVPGGCEDKEYLSALRNGLDKVSQMAGKVDIIFYQAGVDPFVGDLIGGLNLTIDGLLERDRLVKSVSQDRGIPIVILFGGGYAEKLADIVEVHLNTLKTFRQY